MRTIDHCRSLLLCWVLLFCAGSPVAFAQDVPGVNDAAGSAARALASTDSGQAPRENARVALKLGTAPLDIDGNGSADALTDGLLAVRYLFGLRGAALIQDAVGPGATRTTALQIETILSGLTSGPKLLDIDGNGATDALTDGLLVVRYLFGLRGVPLIQGAIDAGATRNTAPLVETYLATLMVVPPEPPAGCTVVAMPPSSLGSPLLPGTPVQLTADCIAGQQPITYTWDGGVFTGSVRNVAPGVTTTYSMVASNAAGPAPAINTTVYVAPPASYCQAGDHVEDVPWPNGQVRPGTNGLFNQVYSFRLAIPFTFNPPLNINHIGFIKIFEKSGQQVTFHEYTISTSACDFHAPPGGYLLDNFNNPNTSPQINFTVNNPGGYQALGANINFQSGDIVYVSVRNFLYSTGSPTCPNETPFTCDIWFDYATPNRN